MSSSRKLHVLFLNAHASLGADVAVHVALARALDRRRVRVSAASTLPEGSGPSARSEFQAIAELTNLSLDMGRALGGRRGIKRAIALLHNARGLLGLLQLAAWCRRHHVDVVHVTERPRQATFGLLVSGLAGCACVIHAHTGMYPHDATRLAQWRLRRADAVVGVSHFTASTYERVGGIAAERVFAVHNAVDGEVFTPEAAASGRLAMRQRLGLPADAPVIGCVARLMRWKGQASLLEAFAQVRQTLPTARLVLAGVSADSAPDGQGDFRDFLRRQAAALGVADAVVFAGFVAQTEMPQFYGALDVLAHPSLEEPFGLAVVEAMASGRPVAAVGAGGIPEIIRDGIDGRLVAPEQPAELAQALLGILTQTSLSDGLGRAGRRRVLDAFTPAKQADAMLDVYEQVARRRSGHATAPYAAHLGSRFANG